VAKKISKQSWWWNYSCGYSFRLSRNSLFIPD